MSAIPPAAANAFDLVTNLTFAITGLSKDKQVYAALGSGFFVAPYTAITAAHVPRAAWDALEMPWNKGKYPKNTAEPEFYLAAAQQVDRNNPYLAAHWEITGVTPLAYTDIAFLNLVPKNEAAEHFIWPKPFPKLQLLPPPVKSRVWSFGYPDVTYQHTPGEAVVNFTAKQTLIEGAVIDHFPSGRASWNFPQFEVTCAFEPGMSGGPVINDGMISGVISYGLELEAKERGPSFAAALWPILGSENQPGVDPRTASNVVLDMLANAAIDAPGWKELQSRISVEKKPDGTSVIFLK